MTAETISKRCKTDNQIDAIWNGKFKRDRVNIIIDDYAKHLSKLTNYGIDGLIDDFSFDEVKAGLKTFCANTCKNEL